MFHICQDYTFAITIMALLLFKKNQVSQLKCSKQKIWGTKQIRIYNTYKNTVMLHGHHIYAQRICHGKGSNVCILIVRSCVTTLDIFIVMLCQMSNHLSS